MDIIQMHFVEKAVKFIELCATLQDAVNPGLSAFTSSASRFARRQAGKQEAKTW